MVRRLLIAVRNQFDMEGALVRAADETSTSAFAQLRHAWHPILHCGVIELDKFPWPAAVDAAVARIMKLSGGELIEVQGSSAPFPLIRRLSCLQPGGYTVTPLESGPPRWRMEVVRSSSW